MTGLIAFGVVGAFVALLLFLGIKVVPQGYHWTVERFGRYTKTLKPGLHLLIPFIDAVGRRQNMMEIVLEIPPQTVISKDNAQVTTDAICFFKIIDPAKAAYEVNDLLLALENLVLTNIRAELGSRELDSMLSSREEISSSILKKVLEAVEPWGVQVNRIEIKDISPPADLVESMSKQMMAERDKRALVLVAEGQKQALIATAEGEKQAVILKAEGDLSAANKQAEARERLAQAEAKATEVVSKAISAGDPQALNYFIAQEYTKTLGKLAASDNNKVMMLPLEATSVIGSIAGITELLKGTAKAE